MKDLVSLMTISCLRLLQSLQKREIKTLKVNVSNCEINILFRIQIRKQLFFTFPAVSNS